MSKVRIGLSSDLQVWLNSVVAVVLVYVSCCSASGKQPRSRSEVMQSSCTLASAISSPLSLSLRTRHSCPAVRFVSTPCAATGCPRQVHTLARSPWSPSCGERTALSHTINRTEHVLGHASALVLSLLCTSACGSIDGVEPPLFWLPTMSTSSAC